MIKYEYYIKADSYAIFEILRGWFKDTPSLECMMGWCLMIGEIGIL
jgi:hypothetical protein